MSPTISPKSSPQTICLVMIVKNEEHVLNRCLESVKPFIDTWSIVDTGSTDSTKSLIQGILGDLAGELHDSKWKDFGTNRTEAIEFAKVKADYLLFIDADEEFQAPAGFKWPKLTADAYMLQLGDGNNRYRRTVLVRSELPWTYKGALHEYLDCAQPYQTETLDGPIIMGHYDGGRSKGIDQHTKYARDAAILEAALKEDPQNTRYAFYLAQSYRDSGQNSKALETYERRVSMGGWEEEVWYSLYQIAILTQKMNLSETVVMDRYLAAYNFRPSRAEPLVYLASYFRQAKKYPLAHLFSSQAVRINRPEDILFLDESCYTWRALDEYSLACYYTGRYEESKKTCEHLLSSEKLPQKERDRVQENLQYAVNALNR